jgi:hypothetical protein
MGTSGTGLWSDDTTADVRGIYRQALEDGASDGEARAEVVTAFATDLTHPETASLVWIALAATQHLLGRLDDDVRDRAIDAIDSGEDLARWEGTSPRTIAQRRAVLTKLRGQLTGPKRARKRISKPRPKVTSLTRGDLLCYRAASGRHYILEVVALWDVRKDRYPIVRAMDWQETRRPTERDWRKLKPRRGEDMDGRSLSTVSGMVTHWRGHDYEESGFELLGNRGHHTHRTLVSRFKPDEPLYDRVPGGSDMPRRMSGWAPWRIYFDRLDTSLDGVAN